MSLCVTDKKCTITVKDFSTGEVIYELDGCYITSVSHSFSGDCPVKVEFKASGFLGEAKERQTPVHVIEEDVCEHDWATYQGLGYSDTYCKLCGIKTNE